MRGKEIGDENYKKNYMLKLKFKEFACQEIAEEEKNNPSSLRIGNKKRKNPIDWAAKEERWSRSNEKAHTFRGKPYEKRQFEIKQCGEFGRTLMEAQDIWRGWEISNCDRDNKGYKGQLRLWIPDEEFKDMTKRLAHTVGSVEMGHQLKNAWAGDRDALRIHAYRSDGDGFGNEFFRGESSLEAKEDDAKERRKAEIAADTKRKNEEAEKSGIVEPPVKAKEQKGLEDSASEIDEDEEKYGVDAKFEKAKMSFMSATAAKFNDTKADMLSKLEQAEKALALSVANPVETAVKTDAIARAAYEAWLEQRTQLGKAWIGEKSETAAATDRMILNIPMPDLARMKEFLSVVLKLYEADAEFPEDSDITSTAQDNSISLPEGWQESSNALRSLFPGEKKLVSELEEKTGSLQEVAKVVALNKDQAEANLDEVKKHVSGAKVGITTLGHLKSHAFMLDQLENEVLSCATPEAFERKKLAWSRMHKAYSQLASGLVEGATRITTHIGQFSKRKEADLKKQRDKASAGALQMQSSAKALDEESELFKHSLFMLPESEFKAVQELQAVPKDGNLPFIVKDTIAFHEWFASEQVQRSMAAFGGKHKAEQSYKEKRFVANPMRTKQGKEETEAYHGTLMSAMGDVFNASPFSPSGWSVTSFQFGLAPMYASCHIVPSTAGMLRTLVHGKLCTVLFELPSLVKALPHILGKEGPPSLSDIKEKIEMLSAEQFKTIKAHAADVYYIAQTEKTLLYVPPGYLMLEFVPKDQPLTYGVRKSFYNSSKDNYTATKAAVDALSLSGTDVSKLQELIKAWAATLGIECA